MPLPSLAMASIDAILRLTKFTCCAPAVRSSSVLGHSAPKIADKAQAGRLVLRLAARRYGHKNGLRRRHRNPFSSGKFNVV